MPPVPTPSVVTAAVLALAVCGPDSANSRAARSAVAGSAAAAEPSLQQLVDRLPSRGGTLQLEAKNYDLAAPLNLRGRAGVRIVGAGVGATTIRPVFRSPDAADLALVDLVGATDWEISGLRIDGRGEQTWGCGVLLGRVDQKWCGRIALRQVEILGPWRVAALVNLGAEVCSFDTCVFWNTAGSGGSPVGPRAFVAEVQNSRRLRGVGPVSGSAANERVSNTCHNLINCSFIVSGDSPEAACLEVGAGVCSFNVLSPAFSAKQAARAAIVLGAANAGDALHGFYMSGAQVEAGAARTGVEVLSPVKGLSLRDCRFLAGGLLDLRANVESLRLDNVTFYRTR
jgi:hypothetical protein